MNLPNILTLSRLGLVAIMMLLLVAHLPYAKSMALVVFAIAGITDYLDGYLARKHHQTTSFGRLMDPLTDKVMVCAAFVSFVGISINVQQKGLQPLVPAWIVVIIISREFLVTGLRLLAAGKGNVISAGKWGKHKTVWQIVAIIVILLGLAVRSDILRNAAAKTLSDYDFAFWYIANAVSLAVAAITIVSGLMYFIQHRELISDKSL
jgi:CDP-diacylglycerol--glycerol-3-phosphate 3-phosphatidyltransferase